MCGITSQFIRRMWLSVADLTLKKTVDIAVSMELTNKEIAKISSKAKPVQKMGIACYGFRCSKQAK